MLAWAMAYLLRMFHRGKTVIAVAKLFLKATREIGWLALSLQAGQQRFLRGSFVQTHQIEVSHCPQQPSQFALTNPHREELAVSECGRPFRLGIPSGEIVRRKHRDYAVRLNRGTVHLENKIGAWTNVPSLNECSVADLLQHSGNQVRPLAVRLVIADEDVQISRCRKSAR